MALRKTCGTNARLGEEERVGRTWESCWAGDLISHPTVKPPGSFHERRLEAAGSQGWIRRSWGCTAPVEVLEGSARTTLCNGVFKALVGCQSVLQSPPQRWHEPVESTGEDERFPHPFATWPRVLEHQPFLKTSP